MRKNKKNIETQLQGVSKAISNIAENIEKKYLSIDKIKYYVDNNPNGICQVIV